MVILNGYSELMHGDNKPIFSAVDKERLRSKGFHEFPEWVKVEL